MPSDDVKTQWVLNWSRNNQSNTDKVAYSEQSSMIFYQKHHARRAATSREAVAVPMTA